MPKMKKNTSAKKRFKKTGTGKIKRAHAFHNHILTKKDKNRKKRLVKFTVVHKTNEKTINRLLATG